MSVLKREDLKGYVLSLIAASMYSATRDDGVVKDRNDQKKIAEAFDEKGHVELKITVEGVEVDARAWINALEQKITYAYNEAVAEQVASQLTASVGPLRGKFQDAMYALDDIASTLSDRASRLTREISEDAYWTTSSSQNC